MNSPFAHVIDEMTSLVAHAEVLAMRNELKPFHGKECSCNWCSDVREQSKSEGL